MSLDTEPIMSRTINTMKESTRLCLFVRDGAALRSGLD
jgi:hypothetical protein